MRVALLLPSRHIPPRFARDSTDTEVCENETTNSSLDIVVESQRYDTLFAFLKDDTTTVLVSVFVVIVIGIGFTIARTCACRAKE